MSGKGWIVMETCEYRVVADTKWEAMDRFLASRLETDDCEFVRVRTRVLREEDE